MDYLLTESRRHARSVAYILGALLCAAPGLGVASDDNPDGFFVRPTLTGDWGGLRSTLEDNGVVIGLTQTSDVMGNFNGGVRRGVEYDGLFQPQVDMDLSKLMGWAGGKAHIAAYVVQGKGISQTNLQNIMTVTNTEYGPAGAKMGEFWIQQKLFDEFLAIKVGQIEADLNFDTIESAAFMVNSTWGWPAIWAQNLPGSGPTYPNAVPGAQLILTPNEQWTFQGAVFNGNPTGKNPNGNTNGLAFPLGQGVLSFAEAIYNLNPEGKGGMPGTYKLGGWYNSQRFNSLSMANNGQPLAASDDATPQSFKGNYSLYASFDQAIWRDANTDNQGPNVFASVHVSPQSDRNQVNWFLEGGLAYTGLIDGRPLDQCAIGFGYLNMSSGYANNVQYQNQYQGANQPIPNFESFIELDYQAVVSPWLAIQPFLTYVINPGARAPQPQNNQLAIPNATVVGVRTIVSF
ncbi:porin [Fluviibacter phosphoraccumulans]|nr:porin [Fluviibacter phosphoraccumulans]